MSLVQEQNLAGEHAFTYPLRMKFYAKFVLCFVFAMQTSFLFTLSSVIHGHIDTSTEAMETEPVWGLL